MAAFMAGRGDSFLSQKRQVLFYARIADKKNIKDVLEPGIFGFRLWS